MATPAPMVVWALSHLPMIGSSDSGTLFRDGWREDNIAVDAVVGVGGLARLKRDLMAGRVNH